MGLVSNYQVLILDITDVPRMGVTAALAVERMVEEAESLGRMVLVAGANERLRERLTNFGVRHILSKRIEALEIASKRLNHP
jgi:SulP family sulfate permease